MPNHILLLTSDPSEAKLLKAALQPAMSRFTMEWLTSLSSAIRRLQHSDIDAVIVNLSLPDSQGIATFAKLLEIAPHTPILALSTTRQATLADHAVMHPQPESECRQSLENRISAHLLHDMMQRHRVKEHLPEEGLHAEIILNSIHDAVICTDLTGRIAYLNPSAAHITGWSREEAHGLHIHEVFRIVDRLTHAPAETSPIDSVLAKHSPQVVNADALLIKKNGEELSIEDTVSPLLNQRGKLTGVVVVFHDTTLTRAIAKKMEHLAQHDFLTGLPNRLLLHDRIAQAIHLAQRANHRFALLFLDLDNFKHINDSLGHETGDKLLQSVAQRLKSCVRHSDTVSRQGGDEFIVLLSSSQLGLDAALTADKILKVLSQPHCIGSHTLQVNASIGISVYPDDGMHARMLIQNADAAMYGAKKNGGNNYKFFRNEMNVRAEQRQSMESDLQTALEAQAFTLHYQPRVDLASGRITAAEALLRWEHPAWGCTEASTFISTAEDCGLMLPIGKWVLYEACRQAKQWMDDGLMPIPVAVNISSLEFHQDNFSERVDRILHDTGLDAGYLQLEISESVLMRESSVTALILRQLRNMQIRIVLDDYGTGSASLHHLQRFAVDAFKIDQSLIHDIHTLQDEAMTVNAMLGIASKLDITVIAEGVENRTQLDFLKLNGCTEAQGYYFTSALTGTEFAHLLERQQSGAMNAIDNASQD